MHHALIGAAGALYGIAVGEPAAGAAFMVGSVAPDFDIAALVKGKRAYLKVHQGFTHSLFVMPVLAAAICGALALISPDPGLFLDVKVLMAAAAGLLLHCLLDLSNCFGIRLLWPIPKRYHMDALFCFDAPAVCMSLGAVYALASEALPPGLVVGAYTSMFTSYALARWILYQRLKAKLGADTVIPAPINPIGAYFTRTSNGMIEWGTANCLTSSVKISHKIPIPHEDVLRAAFSSPVFRDLSLVMRRLTPIVVDRDDDGTIRKIIAANIALPSYGTRIGQVELEFEGGRMVREKAVL